VTEILSAIFNAPAILCGTSRLVVDCNRQPGSEDIIPAASDGTVIPGNHHLSDNAKKTRMQYWFYPYHDDVEMVLGARDSQEVQSVVVSVHSMARSLRSNGKARPWQISLSSHKDRMLADPILAALREPGDVVVGDNQPYNLDPTVDFSIPFHALRRGLPHVQVEFRQDQIADGNGQCAWAARFARALARVVG
jgi:predicted N-formylglutamate amidohydrolase